jgi:hypothetical protein
LAKIETACFTIAQQLVTQRVDPPQPSDGDVGAEVRVIEKTIEIKIID